ncbi:MAG: DUF2336 domain-containing protein [Pseudomonadota bacterium]|nr:DUF2336 domain-containing protein [Pseudomonadota bacterium]
MKYETAKNLAASPDPNVRRTLAAREDALPEVLYYLAGDSDTDVRRAVAANGATPVQAASILVNDLDIDVRCLLAGRLARLLPELDAPRHAQIVTIALDALETLARDQTVKVRVALVTTLEDIERLPSHIAERLARDSERDVAERIVRDCLSLSDKSLLEIIEKATQAWPVEAVAGRSVVSSHVSAAVVASPYPAATEILLGNPGAGIDANTMTRIVKNAPDNPGWHKSLVGRMDLPTELASRLRSFISRALRDILDKTQGIDESEAVAKTAARRVDWINEAPLDEDPRSWALRLMQSGQLTEESLVDALSWNDRSFVLEALAVRAKLPTVLVERIIDARSPKATMALAWKADLNARTGMKLQERLARVPPNQILNPKSGFDYPMTEEELRWQLDFFGATA